MKANKLSISLDAELGERVRDAARRQGQSLSAWLAEAAAARLRKDSLRRALDEYQAEHGAFTPDEIAQGEADLGIRIPVTRP
jgi:hypothetical protein